MQIKVKGSETTITLDAAERRVVLKAHGILSTLSEHVHEDDRADIADIARRFDTLTAPYCVKPEAAPAAKAK